MIYNFADLRIKTEYPPMPCYSDPNSYLEEYFFNFYKKNKDKFARKPQYIPVYWTPIYVQSAPIPVQSYLNVLDPSPSKEYFTIVQFDEGVLNKLPLNTKVFAAASNRGSGKIRIPIPLVVSPIPEELKNKFSDKKNYLCSFIGRQTHPIRKKAYDILSKKEGFYFPQPEPWKQTLEQEKLEEFIRVTKQSKFAISLEGNAPTAFRLYEIMQLGAVPVYIAASYHWLPWQDELDWNEFCVIIKEEQIPDLYDILNFISEEKRLKMLNKIKEIYNDYFSLEGVCHQILKRL